MQKTLPTPSLITAQDPQSQSLDLQADNIAKLKALFPELLTEVVRDGKNGKVTEASINIDVLKALVGDATATDADEKYGLNWHGKRKARQLALTPSTGTLRPCPADSVDWDSTQNLMIEGDNLEVLKLLQKSYAGKVKLIYIDPPYNTGKDFVYPDNFQDNIKNYLELTGQVEGGQKLTSNPEASGRFHTDWLNMMYPRLKLARNLLRDDGLIAVSCDDNEEPRIRELCDQIYGEENFLANVSITSGANQSGDGVLIQKNHENLIIYSKNISLTLIHRVEKTNETLRNLNDAPTELATRKDMGYSIYYNPKNNEIIPLFDYDKDQIHKNTVADVYSNDEELIKKGFVPIRPGFRGNKLHRWRWGFDTFLERKNEIKIIPSDNEFKVMFRQEGFNPPKNVWSFAGGAPDLNYLFNDEKIFDYPKSIGMLKYISSIGTVGDDLVLDFFAGSGTTGHAVMAQNAADNGNRKYILVQLPEPLDPENKDQKTAADFCTQLGKPLTIAELTKERLRRAGAKVKADNPLFAGDVGFRVFKLDTSNIRAWQPTGDMNADLLAHEKHLIEGRTSDDVLYELLLKLGLDLCVTIELQTIAGKACQSIGGGVLMACLGESITVADAEPLALGMAAWVKTLAPAGDVTAVFRDSAFENDVAKSNLAAILAQHGVAQVRSL